MMTRWPKDQRIAVMVTIMFEVWSEGKAPPYSPMTTALKPGTLDLLGISWSQYGGKTGIWRLMKILGESAIPGTVCINAKAAEDFPEAVLELNRQGHEIAGHSYTQDLILPYLEPEEERNVIDRCTRIIEQAVGARPIGWFSPVAAASAQTAEYLAGSGYLWHGDYNDTDLPYVMETARGKLVAIAHSDFTDNRTLRSSPRDFYDVYKDTFDYLYRHESPSLLNLTVHAHFGGRPLMSAMLRELLQYMRTFPDVWFARHDEVARWALT
jgi:peptidoglycan/xylan/chitin deacetylase (PgdA/CDA1 family)